jgi:HPt (histidine-containing phosphotransfer) domain-containing protein
MIDQPPSAPIDLGQAFRLTGDDPELLADLGDELRSRIPELLAELRRAVEGGDADTMTRVAHSLKGALATVAAVTASQRALELEKLGRSGRLQAARAPLDDLEQELGRVSAFLAVPGWSRPG